jgi:predicted GNAT family N-acyltransferase
MALPYEESMHRLAGDLYVRKATVEFSASAQIDDVLDVGMKCMRVGNSSIVFHGGLFRGEQLLVSCELVYVFADPATQTSRPVPQRLRDTLAAYEAGEASMYELATGDWAALGEGAGDLRRKVFIEEQKIPKELEWDAHDATSVHAVARNRLGQVIGTGRLLPCDEAGVSRIGRMAVHRTMRGSGLGAAVLRALEAAAEARGDREVALHAQRSAERFYDRLGYAVAGEPFDEAGIAHIEMRRTLRAG